MADPPPRPPLIEPARELGVEDWRWRNRHAIHTAMQRMLTAQQEREKVRR